MFEALGGPRAFFSAGPGRTQTTDKADRMQVKLSGPEAHDEWESVAGQCSYATFFHRPIWYETVSNLDAKSRVRLARFSFENGHTAILPFIERATMLGAVKVKHSGAAGCYGGLLSTDNLDEKSIDAVSSWLWSGPASMRINPYAPVMNVPAGVQVMEDTNQFIRLQVFSDEEALRRSYRHAVRKNINKGERAGLVVRPANGWDEWEKYYSLYTLVLEKWGDKATSSYPKEFFKSLLDNGGEAVCLWLVLADDKLVGGNLNFYHRAHAVEWHAAFDEDYFTHGSRVFLVHNIILDAFKRGFEVYDFNPSGGHKGTQKFKGNFGALELPASILRRNSRLQEAVNKSRRALPW